MTATITRVASVAASRPPRWRARCGPGYPARGRRSHSLRPRLHCISIRSTRPSGTPLAARRTGSRAAAPSAGWRAPTGRTRRAAGAWASRSSGAEHRAAWPRASRARSRARPTARRPAATHAARISSPASCTRSHMPGSRRVEHDERVQVAVAGVEHVHHREPLLVGDLVDLAQHVDELRARHHRVVQVVVGRDAGDRAERRLPALPQQRPLGVVGRDPHRRARRARGRPGRPRRPGAATPPARPSTSTSSTASASRG